MTRRSAVRGFTLVEALVGTTILLFAASALAGLLVRGSAVSKSQRLTAETQMEARACLALIVPRLRRAGWNPQQIPFEAVTLDRDDTDGVDQIALRADLNGDSDLADEGEDVLIRHVGKRIEWRTRSGGPFQTLAVNISNDADGDGKSEPMFSPDGDPPTRILVRVTAESLEPSPLSHELVRYTVSSDVTLFETP